MEVRVMKKYNTPEMNVSMFNCETVATSENLTASVLADQAKKDGKTVRIYDWSDLQANGIGVSF
jgi:hypothetical protein